MKNFKASLLVGALFLSVSNGASAIQPGVYKYVPSLLCETGDVAVKQNVNQKPMFSVGTSEAGALMDVIAHFAHKKPILGVCLGHQAIAEYFGGSLSLATVPMHGKSSVIHRSGDSKMFKDMPDSFEVGRYHSWIAEAPLPDSLKITASYNLEIMALEHRELPVFGVQFHPESILTPKGRTMIQNYVNVVEQSIPVTI